MTNRNFDEWLNKFRPSISGYDYYIDFEKVVKNELQCRAIQSIYEKNRFV